MSDPSSAAVEPLVVNQPPPQSSLNPATPLPVAARPGCTDIGALFRIEESRLVRFAIGLVGQRTVAEELVQETFLRLHPIWDEVENPRAWLYRSLRNLALNHLRDRPRETELSEETAADAENPPAERLGRSEAVTAVVATCARR